MIAKQRSSGGSRSRSSIASASPRAAAPIRVMLLDGESGGPYHQWQLTTRVLKKQLDETGLFEVDVVTAPPAGSSFSAFKPDFTKYQAVVLNYDAPDERWPADLKTAFERYVTDGGGLVVVHASDNAFPGWKAFNEMIGVGGWRDRTEKAGPFWFFKDGKLTSDTTPGRAGSHGQRLPFKVTVRDPNHPITKGLPAVWMHQGDELYAKLRGPGPQHDRAGHGAFRSGEQRDRPRRAAADGAQLRQGTRVSHHDGTRRQRVELGGLRRHVSARHRVGGDRQRHAEGPVGLSRRRTR